MREIKFKVVWNGEVSNEAFTIGEFIDGVEMSFKDGGTLPFKDIDWQTDSVEYIQYTGLKDKNGKEIYEGDIVCWGTDVVVDSEGGFNRTEPEGQIGTVRYYGYSFYVAGEPDSDFYSCGEQMFVFEELEVIGNIYENPELLNNMDKKITIKLPESAVKKMEEIRKRREQNKTQYIINLILKDK